MIELISNKIFLDDDYEIREYYTEKGNVRALCSDGCTQSLIYIDKEKRSELVIEYFLFYNLPIYLNPNGIDCLMLGGGAISYPHHYISKFKNKKMDVVEINHKCIEYAKKYFYLEELISEFDYSEKRLNIIIDDAIKYISCCKKKYDYILIDLFNGSEPVKEIYIQKNLKYLKNILKQDGVLIVNYIVSKNDLMYKKQLKYLIEITNNYKIITNKFYFDSINNVGNIIIILSNNQIYIPKDYDYLDITEIIL